MHTDALIDRRMLYPAVKLILKFQRKGLHRLFCCRHW